MNRHAIVEGTVTPYIQATADEGSSVLLTEKQTESVQLLADSGVYVTPKFDVAKKPALGAMVGAGKSEKSIDVDALLKSMKAEDIKEPHQVLVE